MIRTIEINRHPYLIETESQFVARFPDEFSYVEHVQDGVIGFQLPTGQLAELHWQPLPTEFEIKFTSEAGRLFSPSLFSHIDIFTAKIRVISKALNAPVEITKKHLEEQAAELNLSFDELLDRQYLTAKSLIGCE